MSTQVETQPFQFNNIVTGLSSAVFNSVSAASLFAGGGSNANWNSVYSYTNTNSATNNPTYNNTAFSKLSSQAFTLVAPTSSIQPVLGSNIASGNYSVVAGGTCNSVLSAYSFIGNGSNNSISDSNNILLYLRIHTRKYDSRPK